MKINFYTQDPTVLPPIVIDIPATKVRKGPSDDRITVIDRAEFPVAKPDKQGNFLYQPHQPQFDGCEAYGVLKTGMEVYSNILQRKLPFAFPGKVRILPHDDVGINAFYSREDHGIHFLVMPGADHSRTKENTLRMAQSLDIGAHEEAGHLLLDGLKPAYLNFELETQAFHEAFGDISAMIVALHFDQVLEQVLLETQGDLRKSNLLSRLGEQAGEAIQALSSHPHPSHNYLRDAISTLQADWKYVRNEDLTEWLPKDEKKLGAEPHNFSRFFSGVWYEILTTLFEKNLASGAPPKTALQQARDTAASLILRAVADFAPETTACYPEIAKAMLKADKVDYGGQHQKLLLTIFRNRRLLSSQENGRESIPKIKLNQPIRSKKEAQKFLEKHKSKLGIEQSSFVPLEDSPSGIPRYIYRNNRGETFLLYHTAQESSLEDAGFKKLQGACYQVKGSLKLGFNKQGELIHCISDGITHEKHRRVQQSLRRCHEQEMIVSLEPGAAAKKPRHFFKQLSTHHKTPYFAYAEWKDGKMVLKRVPVFSYSS